jgi:G3E family GTPase
MCDLDRRERGPVPPFERLVIETTGLADPAPIVATLTADPVLCHLEKSRLTTLR